MIKKSEDIVYDLLSEVRKDIKEVKEDLIEHQVTFKEHLKQDEKLYSELVEMKSHLSQISQTMIVNTASLQEHIQGVETLKLLHIENARRIESLERPRKFNKELRNKILKYCSAIGVIAGALTAIAKFLQYI
jgi:hypothetical protein